jgi:hypothetical protein
VRLVHDANGIAVMTKSNSSRRRPCAARLHFPPRGAWARRTPERQGMDSARAQQAIELLKGHESTAPKDVALDFQPAYGAHKPWRLLRATQARDGMSCLITDHGYIVAAPPYLAGLITIGDSCHRYPRSLPRFQCGPQGANSHRLAHKVVHPHRKALLAVALHGARCERDDVDGSLPRACLP